MLHVGAPKSGTTYLQSVLRHNRDRLAAAGVLVAGETHRELVHAGLVVREDPRVAGLPERAAGAWDRVAAQARAWSGSTVIVSYELLAGATADQAAAAIADLGDADVHVVLTARDFGLAVASAWQERLKFAVPTRLEDWVPRQEEDGPRAEWGWRTMDPAGVLARWGAGLPADHVHLVTVPAPGAPADTLWRRFAEACGIEDVEVDLDRPRVNESLAPAAAEVLRRVNEALPDDFGGNRAHARWLRNLLAHEILAPAGQGRLGISDEQYADALARSEAAITAVAERGYRVHGDLEDLRATRPDGVLPSEVPDGEVLDVAVDALVQLLVRLREQTEGAERAARAARPRPGGLRGLARRLRP